MRHLLVATLLVSPGVAAGCTSFGSSNGDDPGDASVVERDAAQAPAPDGGASTVPEGPTPAKPTGCSQFRSASPEWALVEEGPDAKIEYGIDDVNRSVMRAHASKQSNAALVYELPSGAELSVAIAAKIAPGKALVGTQPKFIELSCASPYVSAFVFLEQDELRLGTSDGYLTGGFADVPANVLGAWTTFRLRIDGATATLRLDDNGGPIQAIARTSFAGATECRLAIGVQNGTSTLASSAPRLEASFEAVCFE